MLECANKVINSIKPFLLPTLVGIVCVVVGAVLVTAAVRQIRRQIKLYNSITLVELKNFKWHYLVFAGITAFFIFYAVTQMADPQGPEAVLMREVMGMKRWQTNVMLGALSGLLLCVEFFLVVLMKSRSAVVDRGIYSGMRYLDWYHVHKKRNVFEFARFVIESQKFVARFQIFDRLFNAAFNRYKSSFGKATGSVLARSVHRGMPLHSKRVRAFNAFIVYREFGCIAVLKRNGYGDFRAERHFCFLAFYFDVDAVICISYRNCCGAVCARNKSV